MSSCELRTAHFLINFLATSSNILAASCDTYQKAIARHCKLFINDKFLEQE
jgi:hypothetical protein